jgi:hypothetical protein
MTPDWAPLRTALAECRQNSVAVPFWWRDDDAIVPSAALDLLGDLSARSGMPVHLAIIPAHASQALVDALDMNRFIPVVHGWAHTDHSAPDEKKNEFLTPRIDAAEEAASALKLLSDMFGDALRPMFVPPWNRIHPDVTAVLAGLGYTALSTFGPRSAPLAANGLRQINTHLDPIWWKGNRDLVDPDALITQTARHLRARCVGNEDTTEPFGLLTHHLVHTPAIWSFAERFVEEMLAGGATPWRMENEG